MGMPSLTNIRCRSDVGATANRVSDDVDALDSHADGITFKASEVHLLGWAVFGFMIQGPGVR